MPSSCPSIEELREKAAAKLSERKRKANVPAKKLDVILDKQRENLRRVINECAKDEEKRATKMERASTHDQRSKLEARFEKERDTDRHRIQVIQDDLNKLKQSISEGRVNDTNTYRRCQRQLEDAKLPAKLSHEYNRFHGLETPVDFILHKATVEKESSARTAHTERLEKMKPKFDMISETKKLHLLQEKRSILKQVIQLTEQTLAQREYEMAGAHVVPSGREVAHQIKNNTIQIFKEHDDKQRRLAEWRSRNSNSQVPGSARSVHSGHSRASTASWASFATSSAPKPASRPGRGASAAARVPALRLGKN